MKTNKKRNKLNNRTNKENKPNNNKNKKNPLQFIDLKLFVKANLEKERSEHLKMIKLNI